MFITIDRTSQAELRPSTPSTMEMFEALARSGGAQLEDHIRCSAAVWARDLRAAEGDRGLGPARRLDQLLQAALGATPTDRARRVAIAGLSLDLMGRYSAQALPASMMALYPATFAALADFLTSGEVYDIDCYAKDARFVAGICAPAGAQMVDTHFRADVPARLRRAIRCGAMSLRSMMAADLDGVIALTRTKGWRAWLEIHTDPRMLSEFHEAGWDACYGRIADLLRLRPEVAGLWGASWFYDPQLAMISPRLAYLRARPLERGAILVRLGPGSIHTSRAVQASPTRRALVESGLYRPVCYAMFWPRDALLAQAEG